MGKIEYQNSQFNQNQNQNHQGLNQNNQPTSISKQESIQRLLETIGQNNGINLNSLSNNNNLNDSDAKRRRRHRTVFTDKQLSSLETLFRTTQYPDVATRERLARVLDLDEERVEVWFKNRRAKFRRQQKDGSVSLGTGGLDRSQDNGMMMDNVNLSPTGLGNQNSEFNSSQNNNNNNNNSTTNNNNIANIIDLLKNSESAKSNEQIGNSSQNGGLDVQALLEKLNSNKNSGNLDMA